MRIDGAKVYETGCKYIMYKDLIGYNMKRLDDIRKEINSAWQGRDYNTFSNSFGKHINEITPLLNYLENEAEILKKSAIAHSSNDKNFANKIKRGSIL